jgi:hypothetical protein
MQLMIADEPRTFVPIQSFRVRFSLPDTFTMNNFQPKSWDGLAAIDNAGEALADLHQQTVAAVPENVPAADWLSRVPRMASAFEVALVGVNDDIGLREPEIAFAVGGFGDVCSAYGLALFRAVVTHQPTPDFDEVYREWLDGTVRVGPRIPYRQDDTSWTLRVITHAYGRIGLVVDTGAETVYVSDKSLACPAESFMFRLMRDVGARMAEVTL